MSDQLAYRLNKLRTKIGIAFTDERLVDAYFKSMCPVAHIVEEVVRSQNPEIFNAPTTKPFDPATPKKKINPNQVVKKDQRYIPTQRLKLEKLQNYFQEQLAKVKNPAFTKTDKLKHLFGIDKVQKTRASGAVDAVYSGYHHDKGWGLIKKGKVEFLSDPVICPKTGMVYVKDLLIEGVKYSEKTFFPSHWNRKKVIDKIIEASQNISSEEIQGTTRVIKGMTKEGMKIKMVITSAEELITAFPYR